MNKGKYLSFLLFFFVGFFLFSFSAKAEEMYDLTYDDRANLITEESEIEAVKEEMKKIQQECHVIFYTTDEDSYKSAEVKCEEYVAERYGTDKSESVIMFLIDMDNREIYLYCTGPAHVVVTSSDALTITDNVYTYATKEDYASCAKNAFVQAYQVVNGLEIKRPMKRINNIFLALFIGFMANFVWMKRARARYIENNRSFKPDKKKGSNRLNVKSDVKYVRTRTYIESSDDSSGGSYGGGGGGGGSSDSGSSGGGHSF